MNFKIKKFAFLAGMLLNSVSAMDSDSIVMDVETPSHVGSNGNVSQTLPGFHTYGKSVHFHDEDILNWGNLVPLIIMDLEITSSGKYGVNDPVYFAADFNNFDKNTHINAEAKKRAHIFLQDCLQQEMGNDMGSMLYQNADLIQSFIVRAVTDEYEAILAMDVKTANNFLQACVTALRHPSTVVVSDDSGQSAVLFGERVYNRMGGHIDFVRPFLEASIDLCTYYINKYGDQNNFLENIFLSQRRKGEGHLRQMV
jgi:hypothetical protein